MFAFVRRLRHPLWWMWLGLLLAARPAAADTQVVADFDGDGEQDRAVVDHRATTIRVWLSDSGRTEVIRSRSRHVQLAARDLDGDHRAELLVAGPKARLHVWALRPSSGAFVAVRRKARSLPTLLAGHRVRSGTHEIRGAAATEQLSFASHAPACPLAGHALASLHIVDSPHVQVRLRVSTTHGPRPPPLTV
jgi:hypothetical protein